MEDRVVLSTAGAHAAAAEVRTTPLARHEAREAAHATRHHNDAVTRHHHTAKHAHSVVHSPSKSKSKSNSTNIFSQFFKSAFGGL
jgi:hypothetical protein